MRDPERLRELARRCRKLAQSVADPATIQQLRRWALELADAADVAEWDANEPGDPAIARQVLRAKNARG